MSAAVRRGRLRLEAARRQSGRSACMKSWSLWDRHGTRRELAGWPETTTFAGGTGRVRVRRISAHLPLMGELGDWPRGLLAQAQTSDHRGNSPCATGRRASGLARLCLAAEQLDIQDLPVVWYMATWWWWWLETWNGFLCGSLDGAAGGSVLTLDWSRQATSTNVLEPADAFRYVPGRARRTKVQLVLEVVLKQLNGGS